MEKIITLIPAEFTGTGEVKGFKFNIFDSNKLAYIYEVTHRDGGVKYYEVFKRKITPICLDFKRRLYSDCEFKETYPKGESFGVWAWTTHSKDKAYDYLNKITFQAKTK